MGVKIREEGGFIGVEEWELLQLQSLDTREPIMVYWKVEGREKKIRAENYYPD